MKNYNPVEKAYKLLVDLMNKVNNHDGTNEEVTIDDALITIRESIGYLGEALE